MNICAIIKDEPKHYLDEWVDHHDKLFTKIYIYDNGGDLVCDHPRVKIIPFPGKVAQLKAYQYHCETNVNEYTLFIDSDEFFISDTPVSKLEYLCHKYGALAFNWQMFGSSGIVESTTIPQMEKFTMALPWEHQVNKHMKTMVNTNNVKKWLNPHEVSLFEGRYDRDVTNGHTDYVDCDLGFINHYYCRSKNDFLSKINRGRADCDRTYSLENFTAVDRECI